MRKSESSQSYESRAQSAVSSKDFSIPGTSVVCSLKVRFSNFKNLELFREFLQAKQYLFLC